VEDQQPDPGDLTTGADAAEPRRRWKWLRRRRGDVTTDASGSEETGAGEAEPGDAQPAPVGKAGRVRRAVVVTETETEPATESATESAPGNAADASDEPASDETEGSESEAAGTDTEPVLAAHRPAGRRLLVAAAVVSGLFVAAGAFAGAAAQPYLADRAMVHTKLEIARTATEAITTLWTYTPQDMDTLPDRAQRYLTGDFAAEYRRYIDAIVPTNKQAEVTNNTQVMGAAVESVTDNEATVLVYTNSVATSPRTKNIPSLRYLSYRLTLQRDGADWRVSRMTAVTKLDLTPQL